MSVILKCEQLTSKVAWMAFYADLMKKLRQIGNSSFTKQCFYFINKEHWFLFPFLNLSVGS